jgi:subtilase family serine protease
MLLVAAAVIIAPIFMRDSVSPTPNRPDPAGSTAAPAELDIGPTPGDRQINFSLVFAYPDAEGLTAFARSVGDPSSPDFRRFLTAEEIGRRFGPSDDEVDRVMRWAVDHGLAIVEQTPQRIAISVTAPARLVESLFGVTLRDIVDSTGRTHHAPQGRANPPDELEGLIASIDGLDSRPLERRALSVPIAAGPRGGMTPQIVDRLYELEPLRELGINGEGQTVAIVSLDTFDPGDVDLLDRHLGIVGPPVEKVPVNGGVDKPGDGAVEVNLDIDIVRAIAPKAQILDYEAPNAGANAITNVVDQIIRDGRADIVTISWGSCELDASSSALARAARTYAAAAAAGISVFAASGDKGAFDCRHQDWDDLRVSVSLPGNDVNVIAVGGTYVSMAEDGTYIDEAAWEEPLSGWATGGGLSAEYPRPPWQVGPGVDNAESNGMRQVPDVAGPGDAVSGLLYVNAGEGFLAGGTSASSPFWAGYAVLVRQLAEQDGLDGLGALGPTLYAVSAQQPSGSVFHDITRGGNLLHNAGVGWDYATGLGSPRGAPLARAIVDYLKDRAD